MFPFRHPVFLPGVFVCAFLLNGCESELPNSEFSDLCQAEALPISTVQGDGYYSPYDGKEVLLRGVVTRLDPGQGFYLEGKAADRINGHSNAVYVADLTLLHSVKQGTELVARGVISEVGNKRDKMTSLTGIRSHDGCANSSELPLTRVSLPLNSAQREALEGMRLEFTQKLTVSDVYRYKRGELTLSESGVLRVPTEIRPPGDEAKRQERENRDRSLVVTVPETDPQAFPVATVFEGVRGVLGHDGSKQLLLLETQPDTYRPGNEVLEPSTRGQVRVVSMNLLNFFNGDGRGGGFPTERGAETPAQFLQQKARTQAALRQIRADVLGVQELENDGFGPHSAARELLDLLNDTSNGQWAHVAPGEGRIGSDVITVGIFYKTGSVEAIGPPLLLDTSPFQGRSRYPLSQVFRHRASGQTFLMSVNHLKSKGSCPDSGENADRRDGQGCWNPARLSAVQSLLPWLQGVADRAGTRRILILGDMNAWRLEDPIREYLEQGYVDLVEQRSGLPQHSFLYWGQTGTLDYMFATPELLADTHRAQIWNINANWPAGIELSEPWLRMSDHDPVIVDFEFSHKATSD